MDERQAQGAVRDGAGAAEPHVRESCLWRNEIADVPLVLSIFHEDAEKLAQAIEYPCHLATLNVKEISWLLPYARPELGDSYAKALGPEYYQYLCILLQNELSEHSGAIIIAGYSLGGMFALWALSQKQSPFTRAVSCSGSLWYPDILQEIELPADSCVRSVYLSLGRQEKSKGPKLFHAVEKCTLSAYDYYKERLIFPKVKLRPKESTTEQAEQGEGEEALPQAIFELNNGGHFDEITARMARGINWTLQNYYAASAREWQRKEQLFFEEMQQNGVWLELGMPLDPRLREPKGKCHFVSTTALPDFAPKA